MKHKTKFLLGTLALILLAAAFWVGQASATTGCFTDTNGHWAEVFICWMKDEGITTGVGGGKYDPEGLVTRAQMAVFMSRQADVPPSKGNIQIVMNSADWNPLLDNTAVLSTANGYTKKVFTSPATGEQYVVASPTLPTSFYGRQLKLSGVEICFDPSVGNVTVTSLAAYVDTQHSGVATTYVTAFSDNTVYTGPACLYYTFTPIPLTAESIVNLEVVANWTTAGTNLSMGRATLVLTPSAVLASPPNNDAPQFDFSGVNSQPSEVKSR
jgi:hypothetical protein